MGLGYVDDMAMVAVMKDFRQAHRHLKQMMTHTGSAIEWSGVHNSQFEATKSTLMDFTCSRSKLCPPMVFQGVPLAPQATHKFLGMLLDQELQWSHQASGTIAKALKWVLAFWRLARPSTGICPHLMRQLFNTVAVPKMAYAADVWYTPVSKRQGRTRFSGSVGITSKLASLQRMATLTITGALCSTVTDVLDLHADVLPVELLLNKICHWAFLWLVLLAPTHPLQKLVYTRAKYYIRSHHSLLHELAHIFYIDLQEVEAITPPSYPPGHWLKYNTTIQSTVEESAACARSCRSELVIYSDGSGLGGHVGVATVMYKAGQNPKVLQLHLGTLEEHTTY